jgi:enoyl-CoA hydratase/carnithine racemase
LGLGHSDFLCRVEWAISELLLASGRDVQVLVEEGFSAKVAILNRPKKLNALTTKMGAGRGFCAGGDVATVYHLGKSGMKNEANDFFAKEYLLNYILGTYKKIHVALLNGIVMGGAVCHARDSYWASP